MELIENKDGTSNIIKSIHPDRIIINDKTLTETCIVSNNNIIKSLNIGSIDDLLEVHIQHLLSSNPELILIGSGINHIFPNINLLGPIAKNNIGFEVMNNHSATRTYNVLVAEHRKVACLLIIKS